MQMVRETANAVIGCPRHDRSHAIARLASAEDQIEGRASLVTALVCGPGSTAGDSGASLPNCLLSLTGGAGNVLALLACDPSGTSRFDANAVQQRYRMIGC